ncbi:MAG: hypothetical protein GY710_26800 [Desulfobacteraceae bacterium]|nr:hypothetical protein [Desulfobacteraceae bacterium]
MKNLASDSPWVIFRLIEQQFAVSANQVKEMIKMPKVVSIPKTPNYFRGIMNLRGRVIPVIDLRKKMGMTSFLDETQDLIDLLIQREQDHKNWIIELESSVKDRREFKLATNPHECAFGKWYDNFSTKNKILEYCLKKFDTPHKKIHSIAIEVKTHEKKNDFDGAFHIINKTKTNELAHMIKLFEEARNLLTEDQKEIALILEKKKKFIALSVDAIETIEKLSLADIEEVPPIMATGKNPYISGLGKRNTGKGLVQLLTIEPIFNDAPEGHH